MMTYHEWYSACKTLEELKAKMITDANVALMMGGNPDRIAAIETAGNDVLKEKGWIDDEDE